MGRAEERSRSMAWSARCWSRVSENGRPSDSHRAVSWRSHSITGALLVSLRSARRLKSASCRSRSSSNASRRRESLSDQGNGERNISGKCANASAPGRSGSRSAMRSAAGSGSSSSPNAPACRCTRANS